MILESNEEISLYRGNVESHLVFTVGIATDSSTDSDGTEQQQTARQKTRKTEKWSRSQGDGSGDI